jgi:hypothetical protein
MIDKNCMETQRWVYITKNDDCKERSGHMLEETIEHFVSLLLEIILSLKSVTTTPTTFPSNL